MKGNVIGLPKKVPLAAAIPIATNMLVALRHIFLCYEVMFLVFALVLRLLVLPRRLARGGDGRLLQRLWLDAEFRGMDLYQRRPDVAFRAGAGG